MVEVKFTKFGANSAFGGFAPGDKLRTSEDMARHLVEEAAVAEYVQPSVQTPAPVPPMKAVVRKSRSK
jgi:hypothetical protein